MSAADEWDESMKERERRRIRRLIAPALTQLRALNTGGRFLTFASILSDNFERIDAATRAPKKGK